MRVAQLCRSLDSSIGEPLPFGSLRACRISLPIETREDGGIGRRGGCHVCRCSWAVRLRYWRGELDGGTRFTAIGQRDLNAHATRQVHLAHVARTRGRRHVEGEDPVTGWRTLPFTLHGRSISVFSRTVFLAFVPKVSPYCTAYVMYLDYTCYGRGHSTSLFTPVDVGRVGALGVVFTSGAHARLSSCRLTPWRGSGGGRHET